MPLVRADQPLLPSILDRLLDDHPDVSRESVASQSQVLRDLHVSVRRDLENLLNTRCRSRSWPKELTELQRSSVSYGIPDLSGADLGNANARRAFLRNLENTIRLFEPRFKSVRVVPIENVDFTDRTLRFRINAMLHAYPAPEPIQFDSALEPGTRNFEIREPRA